MAATPRVRTPFAPAGDVLRWQARWRLLAASVSAVVCIAFQRARWFAGSPGDVAAVLVVYALVVSAAAHAARLRRGASGGPRQNETVAGAAVHVTVLADVAALIAITAIVAWPGHHDWVLVVGFFFVHLAEYSFNRRVAMVVLTSTLAGYLGLTAIVPNVSNAIWAETLLSAAAFVAVAATFMVQFAWRRGRLRRIIALFERAEEGDFSEAYDVAADVRPDAVTAVGAAYNRVRSRLENLVLTDPLTACLNRRGFEQALARELGRASRAGAEVALLAVDLDDFKAVNDTHGHLAGDDVLRQTGGMLLALVRTGDLVARTGGDEFMILCPDTDIAGAEQLGTRVCEQMGAHVFTGQGMPTRLTVSVGIASVGGAGDEALGSELQRRADRALYDAKAAGRNRARSWVKSLR